MNTDDLKAFDAGVRLGQKAFHAEKRSTQSIFRCVRCKKLKPIQRDGGTGYAVNDAGEKTCYACCGELDAQSMREGNRIVLYLTHTRDNGTDYPKTEVSNWPGTLRLPVQRQRIGRHNIAGKRYDVWFNGPDGAVWHGVTYGDNTQICRCRKLKT